MPACSLWLSLMPRRHRRPPMVTSISGPPDLLLVNANVVTMDPQHPATEAVATRGQTILAVGSQQAVTGLSGPQTRTIDCQGMTLLPGFIDAHCHLLATAASLQGVDCGPSAVATIADLQRALGIRAGETPRGQWVRGFGYDDLDLREKRHPTRWELDAAAPFNPVRLDHRSGHATVLNSQGLRLAGINRDTPDPVDGVIQRVEGGAEPTGLFFEMAGFLGERIGRSRDSGGTEAGMARLSQKLLSYGITSVQDAGPNNDVARWDTLQKLQASGHFAPRVTMMAGTPHLDSFMAKGSYWGHGDWWLRLGHVKIMLTLTTGSLQPDAESLRQIVHRARRAGFPVAIHAIQKDAVEAAAQALSEIPPIPVLNREGSESAPANPSSGVDPPHSMRGPNDDSHDAPPASMPRNRIEHCAECSPELASLLARSGAMVVTQPGFLFWNGDRYRDRVEPSLLEWLYPVGGLVRSGVSVAFGSDAPAIDPNPWPAIYSAVTGATKSSQQWRTRGQEVSVESALRMYTMGGAYAEGSGQLKGSIQAGKLADLTLVDVRLAPIDPAGLKNVRPVMTILGGRPVWEA